ncbi:hypothetical protein BN341_2160 [Helicobacter heilmannii ASB1.4]|uniref:Uncharacterized protein n=1 Tax=Helicobacter heilmannii TaxID=35817 RepID=A0A0K2Y591_HELHE|nr:hypothetical protein BN341_2160 [Helicobacter heilmannii ASB1.4]CRI34003.1 hypothetical protein HHE01_16890 [Helicobacter heilmannii]
MPTGPKIEPITISTLLPAATPTMPARVDKEFLWSSDRLLSITFLLTAL